MAPAPRPLRPSWPLRPAQTPTERALAGAVATAAAAAAERLPDPASRPMAFGGLAEPAAMAARVWAVARAGAPVFAAEPPSPDGVQPAAEGSAPGFDAQRPLELARSIRAGFRIRAGGAQQWLPDVGALHNDIVRVWECRVAIDALIWEGVTTLPSCPTRSLLVAAADGVSVRSDGGDSSVLLAPGEAHLVDPGRTASVGAEGRGLALQVVLQPFDGWAALEHFRVMAGHHPLMRADLPVDGRLQPRSYGGSLLDAPDRFGATVLELFDAIDPSDARAWWNASLRLVAEAPPVLEPAGHPRLGPVFPAAPAFLADAGLVNEPDVDCVLASCGFGIPLYQEQLTRLARLVAGEQASTADDDLLDLLAPTGLLRSMS